MVQKALFALFLLLVGYFAVGQIRNYLRSPEEQLLWRVNAMVEGFNEGSIRKLTQSFHSEFRDESSGAMQAEVHQVLVGLVLSNRDPETKSFALHATWVEPFAPILNEDESRATADVHLRIIHTARGQSRTWWEARATLEFVYENGDWYLFRSRSVNHRERG
ncbi:MAG: hypothetical protein KDB61_04795 [Planctomycetes bacterium]|nr:hypothetical protein [Planctomycetota bacterium]